MTTPNSTSSVAAVLTKQNVFRLYRPILGPGAIFEIDTPFLAAWIGPYSDIAEIRLQHLDTTSPGLVDQAIDADVSVGGPYVGRTDVLLSTEYEGTGQKGRVLAFPVDIVDPLYVRPTGPGAVPRRRFNVPPYIDLICALDAPAAIPAQRPDFTHRFPRTPFQNAAGGSDDGSTDVVIPFYGRRLASILLQIPAGIAVEASVYLAALQPGTTQAFAKLLGTRTYPAVSVRITDSLVVRASDAINHDEVDTTGTIGADAVATTTNDGPPLPACKGMADLLIINLKPAFSGMPPVGYSLVSVFVKVSDREE